MSREAEFSALLAELHHTTNRLVSYHQLTERTLATGFGVLGAVTVLALANGHYEILMGFPIAVALIYLFVLYLTQEVLALGGYGAALEEELNLRTQKPLFVAELKLARMGHRSPVTIAMWVVLGTLAAGFSSLALWLALWGPGRDVLGPEHREIVGWVVVAAHLIVWCLVVIAAHATRSLHRKRYKAARANLGNGHRPWGLSYGRPRSRSTFASPSGHSREKR